MKTKKKIKIRSWEAIAAWNQTGAGKHTDHKRYNRKRAKKVVIDD